MKLLSLLFKFLIPLLVILLLVFYWQHRALRMKIEVPEHQTVFEVVRGESFQNVLLRLEKDFDFNGRLAVKFYCKASNECAGIRQGEYILPPFISVEELLERLREGKVKQYKFTIIEGWRVSDMLKAIKELPNIEHKLLDVDEVGLMPALGLDAQHPEGLFLAETYFYQKGDTDISILLRARQQLNSVLNLHWRGRDSGLPYNNSYEALTMASIVEKETSVPAERPQIAGVFTRRLQQNWKLQTDPTVIYGAGPDFDGNLTRKHLREDTPYNTYVIRGLPPTPIALVGEEAIRAVMHPDDGEDMYFVAKGDGSHYFSKTLEEHEKAVDLFQRKKRNKEYRSFPIHKSSGKR